MPEANNQNKAAAGRKSQSAASRWPDISGIPTRVCHFIQYIIIKFFLILQGFPCFFNTHMI